MANTALLPLAVNRWAPAYRTVRLVGIDATGSSSRIEVRAGGDIPGAPLLRLDSTTAAGAAGIRLVGVTNENGGPVSTFELVIGDTAIAALPFSGASGAATELAYDWIITIAGRKRVLAGGPFIVLPGVTGADPSPVQRQSAFVDPAAPDRTWDTAELTFAGGEIIEVSINGVALLVPYVIAARTAATEAVSARDEAVNAARTTRADRAATAADRVATFVDRVQAGVERQQAQAASAATIDAITRAGGSVVLPIAFPALTIAAMRAAAIPANGTLAQLLDPMRAGLFRYDSSDLSAFVAIDTDAALYVAPAARPTGTLGAWVRVRGDEVQATWSGVGPNTENAEAALNRLLALMSPGDWLVLPPYEMGIQGKVTLPFGVNIRGGGKMTSGLVARTDGKKAFHGIHFKFGSNIAQSFYCGGMKGQLTVGEAAAFHAYPAEVQTGVPLPPAPTADVTNITLIDLRATDCETGFRMGYNVTATDGSGTLFRARGVAMTDCDSEGILSHNIELFASHDIVIRGGRHVMVDGAAADPQKMLRLIGCRRVKASGVAFFAPGTGTVHRGIYIEMACPYSRFNYWQIPGDIELTDVSVSGSTQPFVITCSQGTVAWRGGVVRGNPALVSTLVNIGTRGYQIEPQVVRPEPPGAGERGIKYSAHRVSVSGLRAFDFHELARWVGKIDFFDFKEVVAYGPANTQGRYAMNAEAGNTALDVYRVRVRDVQDLAPRTIGYMFRLIGGQPGSTIDLADCQAAMTKVADRSPISFGSGGAIDNVAVRAPSVGAVQRLDPALYSVNQAAIVERDSA